MGDVANFGKGAAKVTDANIDRVRRDLGQTGMEAGHLGLKTDRTYIGTGRAYNINQYIRTDGKEYKTDQSPYWNDRITPQQIVRDIRRIDAGMKGLKQDTQLFRFERGDMLGNILANAGLTGYDRNNIGSLIQQLKGDPAKLQTFANILRGRAYVNKGYNSFSYLGEHPGFAEYDVQIRIVAKAGTADDSIGIDCLYKLIRLLPRKIEIIPSPFIIVAPHAILILGIVILLTFAEPYTVITLVIKAVNKLVRIGLVHKLVHHFFDLGKIICIKKLLPIVCPLASLLHYFIVKIVPGIINILKIYDLIFYVF